MRKPGRQCLWFGLSLALGLAWPPLALGHGEVHKQIAEVSRQIAKDRGNAELYLKRGELHRVHRDWNAALADYVRALKLAPALIEVEFCRGRMWLEANRPRQARLALDRFLARRPDHPEALVTRARTLEKLGRHAAAAADYTRAIALLPRPKPDYYLERASAQVAADAAHPDVAVRGLDEGIQRLGPLVTLQLAAIELELKQQRWEAALARLDQLAAQSPRQEMWLHRRGKILQQAGRVGEAQAAFTASLKAIESLPPRLRQTRAMMDLEKQVRSALAAQPPRSGKE
jgi:tetratricopeptide (TPR) repeat protein